MEGGRPEDKRVKRKEGGRTHAKLLTKLQNGERQQRGSDEGGFGRPVNCNWEEGDLRWGPDLRVMQQNWSGKGGGSSAVRAKERSHRGQDECRVPEEIFQW